MTSFAASSIGQRASTSGLKGVVTGVFDQTCNIRLKDGSQVTCATADYFNMPRGILVDAPENFKFRSYLNGGAAARCRGGILRFSQSDLKIDLRHAQIWSVSFKPTVHPTEHVLTRLWRTISPQNYFGFNISLLNQSLAKLVDTLIGRGPGLTPAGDDILTGLLAAPNDRWCKTLAFEISNASKMTTDISRQMLRDAANGHFIEPISNLKSALYGTGNIDKAFQRLQFVGSSSGDAMAMGLLAGIAYSENICLEFYKAA